jgi:hypothetical protein
VLVTGATPGYPVPDRPDDPQWRGEQILRERLADLGVAVELGAEVRDFSQHADGVTVTIGEAEIRRDTWSVAMAAAAPSAGHSA